MIEKLKNSDIEVSKTIRSVFKLSYTIEAKLLNVSDFPPLKRPLESYINSNTVFFGYLKDGELAGVIEIEHTNKFTDIYSLVVNPNFFRQGIARKLMSLFLIHTIQNFLLLKRVSKMVLQQTCIRNLALKKLSNGITKKAFGK